MRFKTLLATICLLTSFAHADPYTFPPTQYPSAIAKNGLEGRFFLGLDGLYWKPMDCEPQIVIQQVGNDQTPIAVNPDYDGGVRFWLGYSTDCVFLNFDYAWINWRNFNGYVPETGATLITPGLNGGAANLLTDSILKQEYQEATLRFGRYLHDNRQRALALYASAFWASVSRRQTVTAVSVLGGIESYRQNASMTGGGVTGGFVGKTSLWRCFSAFVDFHGGWLMTTRAIHQFSFFDGVNFFDRSYPAMHPILPLIQLHLGISARYAFCNATLEAAICFDVTQIWKALEYVAPPSDPTDSIFTDGRRVCRDFGAAGPSATLRLIF